MGTSGLFGTQLVPRTPPTTLQPEQHAGLSDEFANDQSRQALWVAFLKKNALPAVPLTSHGTATQSRSWCAPAPDFYFFVALNALTTFTA